CEPGPHPGRVGAGDAGRRITRDDHVCVVVRTGLHEDVLAPAMIEKELPELALVQQGGEIFRTLERRTVLAKNPSNQEVSARNRKRWRLLGGKHVKRVGTQARQQAGFPKHATHMPHRFAFRMPGTSNREVAIRHQITRMGVWAVTLPTVSFSTTSPYCIQQCAANGSRVTPMTILAVMPFAARYLVVASESNRQLVLTGT